ncbi:protein-L-isoaspartate O-methyltransferase [Thiohalobacter sp. IOR34]|uniref:protein-L-isoaspartate O-methyltransferase family protein n=1 Tax=Thiohalobacter sp. IOR34 TaxID=3057176 RepID=UPI0025B0AB4B|nr:protein-L-isoaspartate O-methyltransferase [Thiohalobacter sp. IOR34]WJW75259.1 protein-L-isoaspartate O-methyltransferase [Thiohalobacter sp. IOR34]
MSETATAFDFEQARFNMIEQQIRPWDVLDQRVLDVLAATPREDFVPPAFRSSLALADVSLPLGHGQTMLPPRLEGRILQSLEIDPGDRILEIGTGSGYLTACLARLGDQVLSVDIFPEFLEDTGRKLEAQRIHNVELRQADAAAGWPAEDRFDVIVLTGSLPEFHDGFHRSLGPGGRLFLVAGRPPIMEAMLITRIDEDQWSREDLFETSLPPLLNAPLSAGFSL